MRYNNTHPFQYNSYVFCHNGKIINFLKYKSLILKNIDNKYIEKIKGETDSEYIFFLLLTLDDLFNNVEKVFIKLNEFFLDNDIKYY